MDKYLSQLVSVSDGSIDKYEYEVMRYFNDTTIDLRNDWEYNWYSLGFDRMTENDLLRSSSVNVIKSIIDSIVSKISNQKVRPFFNPVNGTWETKRVVKNIQKYFDILFDSQNINIKVSNAFRNACINGKSFIWVNTFKNTIDVLPAHTVATLSSEKKYGDYKHVLVDFRNFPAISLKDYGASYDGNAIKVRLRIYYDMEKGTATVYVNSIKKNTVKVGNVLPFVEVNYNTPVFGNKTTSLVQELDGIQTQIDYINAQISAATQLSPANQTFVIEGSNLTPKDLSNKAGTVYGVKMPAGVNVPPVVSVTPRMFDPQWKDLLEYYIKQAYEIAGISQLSAMSKKPSGLDSGTALATMEDIESDRFETQVSNYIRIFIELARTLIDTLPDNDDILPPDLNVTPLKWKDVKKQANLFKVQYSAATQLSKDPAEKVKQIMQMSQAGLVTPDKVAQYLDMPDLESAYEWSTSAQTGVEQCIQRAIEEHDYDVPTWVSFEQLAKEITVTQNMLYGSLVADDDKNNDKIKEAIKSLTLLEDDLMNKMQAMGFIESSEEVASSESGIVGSDTTPASVADTMEETYNDNNANPTEVEA